MSLAYYKKLEAMEKDAGQIIDQLFDEEQRIKYTQFKQLLKEAGHYCPEKWYKRFLVENDSVGLVTGVPE